VIILEMYLAALTCSLLVRAVERKVAGRSLQGRSACSSCGRLVPWVGLVPVVGYIVLGGKCAYCKSRIPRRYPVLEFLWAVVIAGIFLAWGGSSLLMRLGYVLCYVMLICGSLAFTASVES
jgi:leader peptidase (prepilin peptidase) / N-methyltransferase